MKANFIVVSMLLLLSGIPAISRVSASETIEYSYQNNDGWEYIGDINAYYKYNGSWYYRTVGLFVRVIQQKTFYRIKVEDEVYAITYNDLRKYSGYEEYQYRAGDYFFKTIN